MSRRDTFFYTRLESLRGLAALTVAAMHAGQAEWSGATHPLQAPSPSDSFWILVLELLRVLLNGQGMVNLFFVLSGFVLMASIARGPSQIGAATRRFVAARVFRLYPAIWAIIPTYAVVFLLFGQHVALYPADITITQVVSNMLLLDHSMNGAMWSIQMEIIAAPLVILSALISRRWGIVSLIVIVCALFILSFHGAWTRGIGTLSFNPLFCFGLGILMRYASAPIGWLKKYQSVLLFLLAACLFCFARVLLGNSTGAYRWITIAEGCAAAIMIAVIAYRNDANFARPLDWPTLRFYGRISYSLYLLHPLAIAVLWAIPDQLAMALRAGMPDAIVAVGRAAGTILVVTPLAWVCWRYVEVPGIALGRLLERRRVRLERIVVHESA
jgi:peptidoglycan/LPS O-acetylase OafA/YrhL